MSTDSSGSAREGESSRVFGEAPVATCIAAFGLTILAVQTESAARSVDRVLKETTTLFHGSLHFARANIRGP